MHKTWRSISLGVLVLTLLTSALVVPFVPFPLKAQEGAGQGLEISPPLIDVKADPGQVIETQMRLRNITNQTLVARAQYNDFVAGGEDGQARLLLESGETSPYSIKDWLSTIPNITLASQEQKTFGVTITVPQDASPGGHYGVIRFTGAPPEVEESAVSLSASIGTLILVNVSGDVKEETKIVEVYTSKDGKKRQLFEYGPITIGVRLENSGNVHIQPTGTVRVINIFGKETASFEFNQGRGNVLPASIRKFEQTLQKKLLFGRYKVQADVVFGSDNKILSVTHTFWVIPYKLIVLTILMILTIFFLIRGYNRLILKRADKRRGNGPAKKKK